MKPAATETRLRDGSIVAIRPIDRADGDRLREVWEGMSEVSRRRRFLTPTTDINDEDLRYLVDVDHRRHEALLALDEAGHGVAEARYVRSPDDRGSAELAVVVADDWHRRGLATELLSRLSERARDNGIERYTAIVSEDNTVVLDALERAGAERTASPEQGQVELEVGVPEEGVTGRLGAALRAAAEAQRDFLAAVLRRIPVWRRDR